MKDAKFYNKLEDNKVQCKLCAFNCFISENKVGNCRVRKNIDGKLYSLVYGKAVTVAVDPIEKKPLFHFAPGTKTLSYSTVGCNFHCRYCQNWTISQPENISGENISPQQMVELAKKYNTQGISHTYTEPTIFYEYAYDIAKLANKEKLYNVWVTNGYINKKPLKEIAPYLDAANVDLKAFSKQFYQSVCLAPDIKPVLETIKRMHKLGIHIEITNLVIPGFNDKKSNIEKLVNWVAKLDENIPLHFSKFHPDYKMADLKPTPLKVLEKAHKIAKGAGLKYVYLGNIPTDKSNTYCPNCGELLIERKMNQVDYKLKNNNCFKCSANVPVRGLKYK